MKRTNFTCFHQKAKLLVLVLAVLCCYSTAYSQYCSMTCNQGLQVSLNGDCEALVTYDMMLEDPHNPQTCLPNGAQAFQVQLIDAAGNVMPSSPYVNSNHIGQTVVVKVKHWATGNICWGSITVEDKLPPHIFCEDEYVWCNEDDISPGNIGFPFYYDNCDNNLDYEFWDTWHDLVCDEEYRGYVTRRWRVCDDSDNCSECEQTIFYRTAGIPDVHFPRNYDEWDLPALDCANPCTTPDCTGVPYKDGSPIDSDHSKCRIDVDYEDQILEICHASYTILRHWTVVDQCTHEIVTHTQTIKVLDKTPPTVTCPPIYAETSPWYCYGDVHVPPATIVDDCDDTWITVTTKVYGYGSGPYTGGPLEVLATLDGNGGYVTLDKGDYVVKYFVSDGCHNHSEPCVTDLHVEDKTPPTAVCDVQTTVTLQPADCEAKIFARTFDDGSHDNCCSNEELTFKVKRMGQSDAAFDDYVSFDVDDLTCNGADPVMVVMRVFDCWDPSLYSECMVEVFVEDKTPPIVTCPPNQTIYCDEDPWGLLGPVTVFDACGYTLDSVDTENIDNCGEGFVQRRYTATDLCGNVRSCTHRITIEHKNDWSVRFPKDVIVIDGDCTFNDDDNGPEIIGDDCELISIDYEDEIFTVVPDACYKIVRKWKIANWCIHNPDNADPSGDIVSTNCNWRPLMCGTPNDYRPGTYRWLDDGGDGYVEYLQVIKVLDNVEPIVECSAECEPNVEGNGCFTTHISSSATDNCTPEDELTYTWKIYDADHNLVESGNGSSTTFVSPVKGDYDVHFEVEDRCGNIGECVYNFRHEDCKKPTPYCLNGISIDLMPTTSMVTVWATDFNQGSFDNCSDQEDLVYRINSPSGGPGQTNPPNATSVTFDCGDIGTQTVDMWVGDECGNWDYCTTYVIVQDNMGACPCDDPPCGAVTASISGEVMTEMHENVEAVNISIEGTSNAFPQVTGNDGSYAFPNLSMGQNYTVTPEKDMDYRAGITAVDVLFIQRHILGLSPLNNPYRLIAADVNNSETITGLDLVALRKLILFIDNEFANNSSWRFVEENFEFPDANNPFLTPFPEVASINGLEADAQANFMAIKIGDVNASVVPNGLLGSQIRTTAGDLVFSLQDEKIKAGESYTVDFTAKDFGSILGYQFTLGFDKAALELVDVQAGDVNGITADNFGLTMLDEGYITTMFANIDDLSIADETVLFSLSFVAKQDVRLSETMNVNSRYTKSEGYNSEGDLLEIGLSFGKEVVGSEFALYQNTPNPFKGETMISFNLSEAGSASLKVYDVSGKVLKVIEGDYAKGYNQVVLSKKELSARGILYYELSTANDTATKKMLLID